MADVHDRAVALRDDLIEQYDSTDMSKQARTHYTDTLKLYASSVALVASQSIMDILGVEGDCRMLELTAEQYAQLEASDMLDAYIEGKEDTDD